MPEQIFAGPKERIQSISRGGKRQNSTVAKRFEEGDGRPEGPLAAEDGPRVTSPRVKVVRGVRVDPREFLNTPVRDLHLGPRRGSRQVGARPGRRRAARVLRLVPAHEVTGDPTPMVAGRRQLRRRGALQVGLLDVGRRRQDVVEGRHQRRVRGGVVHEPEVRTAVAHLAAAPHHGDRRGSVAQGRYAGVGQPGYLLREQVGGRARSIPRNVAGASVSFTSGSASSSAYAGAHVDGSVNTGRGPTAVLDIISSSAIAVKNAGTDAEGCGGRRVLGRKGSPRGPTDRGSDGRHAVGEGGGSLWGGRRKRATDTAGVDTLGSGGKGSRRGAGDVEE